SPARVCWPLARARRSPGNRYISDRIAPSTWPWFVSRLLPRLASADNFLLGNLPHALLQCLHEVDDRPRLAGDGRGNDLAAFDFCIDHRQDSQAVLVAVFFRFKLVAGHSLNKPCTKFKLFLRDSLRIAFGNLAKVPYLVLVIHAVEHETATIRADDDKLFLATAYQLRDGCTFGPGQCLSHKPEAQDAGVDGHG